MDAHSDMSDVAPLAWSRAIAFGIVAGGMGVLGHDLVARTPTQPWMLLAGIVFAMSVARPLAPLRIGAPTMVAGLAVLQTAIHLACVVLLDATPDTGAVAHVHAHMTMPGSDLASGGWPMLLAHAMSLLVGAAVLLTLERHAWSGVRTVVRTVAGMVRSSGFPSRTPRATSSLSCIVQPTYPRSAACRDVAHALGTRGPPRSVVAFH